MKTEKSQLEKIKTDFSPNKKDGRAGVGSAGINQNLNDSYEESVPDTV